METLIHCRADYFSGRISGTGTTRVRGSKPVSFGAALESLQCRAQKNMTFITPYLPPTVSGEHGQLPQVFQNLLANSLKDCNEVEASRICLIAMRNGADRLLTVEDHSDLFQPELIFKPLKRLWAASEGLSFASTVYFPFRVGNK